MLFIETHDWRNILQNIFHRHVQLFGCVEFIHNSFPTSKICKTATTKRLLEPIDHILYFLKTITSYRKIFRLFTSLSFDSNVLPQNFSKLFIGKGGHEAYLSFSDTSTEKYGDAEHLTAVENFRCWLR